VSNLFTPEKETEQGKEPWQMTREEFVDKRIEELRDSKMYGNSPQSYKQRLLKESTTKAKKEWYSLTEKAYIDGKPLPLESRPDWALTAKEIIAIRDGLPDETPTREEMKEHSVVVRSALSEGKPVPELVIIGITEGERE